MNRRRSAWHPVFPSLALLLAVSIPAASQGPPSSAALDPEASWTPPRTSWGDPDLTGNFTNKDETAPLERPVEFGLRAYLTAEEYAERDQRAREQHERRQLTSADTGSTSINPGGEWLEFRAASRRTSLIVDPPDGRLPPQTADAQLRAEARRLARAGRGPADSFTDRSLYDRCISRGLPGSMVPVIYGNSYRIVQAPGFVAISYEMIHETRVIPLDGRPHIDGSIRGYMGDARGRWEGDTLVVETTHFHPEMSFRGSNPDTMRLTERFTPVSPDAIEWRVTVDDPATWERPWTFAMHLTRDDSEAIMEYACHEGNLAMANILSGHRADEARAAEAAAAGD
jgi:hypothetical protein